jgi:nucleotide-binding universal stress UspA family protein
VIVHEALRWPADLILVGARSKNIVEKLVHGSVSESVAVDAPCSVQVLPLRKKENLSPA